MLFLFRIVRQARKTKDNSSYDELKLLSFRSESQFFELTFPSACRLDEREYSALVKTLSSFCQSAAEPNVRCITDRSSLACDLSACRIQPIPLESGVVAL